MGTIHDTLRRTLAIATLVALALGIAGFGAYAPTALGQASPAPAPAAWAAAAQAGDDEASLVAAEVAAELFVRTELFFGTSKPDGSAVTPDQWRQFLDQEITPRFPDGLTVLTGDGQFRNAAGTIIRERSFVLILLYPVETRRASSAKIEQIRVAYKESFQQESVLRVDDVLPVRTSF
jgi:hypothetical protein